MSTKLSTCRGRATNDFIKTDKHEFSLQMLCRVIGVVPSGYYDWLRSRSPTGAKRMYGCFV